MTQVKDILNKIGSLTPIALVNIHNSLKVYTDDEMITLKERAILKEAIVTNFRVLDEEGYIFRLKDYSKYKYIQILYDEDAHAYMVLMTDEGFKLFSDHLQSV